MRADPTAPFVVGRWVRGEGFFGRQEHVTEILDGPRDSLWILGTRRIGKTSLLRQVELLAESSSGVGDFPVFWDLEGVGDIADLSRRLGDALSAAGTRLDREGLGPGDLEAYDVFALIGRLRRHLRSRRRRLLLLCDGAEGLIRLGVREPAVLRKLRRTLQAGEDLRTVLAATPELQALTKQSGDTSPFLHGFVPPLTLRPLSREEALALVRRARRPSGSRATIDETTAERMYESTGGHPYLLQELGRRLLELGSLEAAVEQMATDASVSAVFSSDLDTLPRSDRAVLGEVAEAGAADRERIAERVALDAASLTASLFRLRSLGLVRHEEPGVFAPGNPLLRRWLEARPKPESPARVTELVVDLSRAEGPESSSPEELLDAVYQPLRRLARHYLRRERPDHTLQPTALVHEAYLKLVDQSRVDWKGRTHFFAVGARAMRRILIDHARTRKRAKRGGDWMRVTLTGLAGSPPGGDLDSTQLLALHAALEKLAQVDARQARVVELRYFGGLKMSEVAGLLGVSKRTADGDWAKARAWLERELAG